MDHVLPRKHGGLGMSGNRVISCPSCNTAKSARTIEEFRWIRTRQRDNIPYFTPTQIEWLTEHGFDFPESAPHRFWFEEQGMVL